MRKGTISRKNSILPLQYHVKVHSLCFLLQFVSLNYITASGPLRRHQFEVRRYVDSNYEEIAIKRSRIYAFEITIDHRFTASLKGKVMVSTAQIQCEGRDNSYL